FRGRSHVDSGECKMKKVKTSVSAQPNAPVMTPMQRHALAAAVGSAFALPQIVYALPTGGQAQVGNMVITTPTATSMVITHDTIKNIAGFQTFNTVAGETVRVNFTNGGSALYRVDDPVRFYGSLSSNGQITISSLGGLLFGGGSLIDVPGLVATSLS